MKKIITLSIAILSITFSFAQEKRDNYLGLNFGTSKSTFEFNSDGTETTNQFIGLKYSNFLSINRRLSLSLGLNSSNQETNVNSSTSGKIENNGFNIGVDYGMLYSLLQNFYAEASPFIEYSNIKGKQFTVLSDNFSSNDNNTYGLGLRAGLLWLPFKHFGISTSIVSLKSEYSKRKVKYGNSSTEKASTLTLLNSGNLLNQTVSLFYKF